MRARSYYNEIDPYAAAWLKNLIAAGHIAEGDVDTRSIVDVTPADLAGYTQCHFFAGIGVWSYALRLAGWGDDRPVWTGSCPCQPFSQAGKGGGIADERHLWPYWDHLIKVCRPGVIFGEQVASPAGLGWFDTVQADLENALYACFAADLCAAGAGAPHIRQRLYFVADTDERIGRQGSAFDRGRDQGSNAITRPGSSGSGVLGELALPSDERCEGERLRVLTGEPRQAGVEVGRSGEAGGLGDTDGVRSGRDAGTVLGAERSSEGSVRRQPDGSELAGAVVRMGDDDESGPQRWRVSGGRCSRERSAWTPSDFIWCRDGKWRPVEPGSFPLSHGITNRVGRLRAYGNAIVAPLAATFIAAYDDSRKL